MQLTNILFAALSFGSMALATDATAAVPSPAALAAPKAYCDKYSGRERRECESDPGYCNKFDGRERRECNEQHGGSSPRYPGSYCNKYSGRERRDCESDPNYCNKFDGRERRECNDGRGGGQAPGWGGNGPSQGCNQFNGQCMSRLPSNCKNDCDRSQRDGFARPSWCYTSC